MPGAIEAEVRLHGRRVGEIQYARGGAAFLYEDDLSSPDHQTLGQVFEDAPRAVRRERVGIPSWFANLLPEGALRRQVIREMGGGCARSGVQGCGPRHGPGSRRLMIM